MALRSTLDRPISRIRAAQEPPSIAQLLSDYKTYDPYILRLLILALSEYMYLTVENGFVSLLTVKANKLRKMLLHSSNLQVVPPLAVFLAMPRYLCMIG